MASDILVCRYRLTGPLKGVGGVYSGQVFQNGVSAWVRMSSKDWASRDRNMCRFYSAVREFEGEGDGETQQDFQSESEPKKPVHNGEAEPGSRNGAGTTTPPKGRGRGRAAASN